MNQHRTSKCGCEHIIAHATDICPGHNFTYQIIEKLPGTGYVDGKLDPNMSKLRKEHEDEWIKKLRTIYPYGLNEKASGKETDSQVLHSAVGKMFPPLPRSRDRPVRSRANKNNRNPPTSSEDFFTTFDSFFPSDIKNSFNNIRIILNSCKKKLLKEIAYNILERENFVYIESREQWYHYILDVIETRLWKNVTPPEKTSYRQNPCIIHFVNKGLNKLGLSKIFRSEDVVNSLPTDLQGEKDIPFPSYKLDAPIRSKILNYKDAVNSLKIDIDEDVSVVHNLPSCDCSSSSFCDPHHQHIVTGDLRIIENAKLKRLFSKGPNFREAKQINLKKCRESIIHALDDIISTLSDKYSIDLQSFSNWKNAIISKVDSRINSIRITPQLIKPVLQDPDVRAYLDELHQKFVVVPIDKAANNVAIICKRFYLSSILQELGVPGNTSPTYELVNRSAESIIETNIMLVQSKLGVALDDLSQTLPQIYWMPKMHYTPCRKRFIIASSR